MTDVSTAPSATASHRDRLLAGMAEAIREKGFARTTVADVVRHARVSRRTFYEHFDDLVACYLALAELIKDMILRAIDEAVKGSAGLPLEERLSRAVAAYLDIMASDPALTRSYTLEQHLAGERGHAHMLHVTEQTARLLMGLSEDALNEQPDIVPLELETALMVVAGIRELAMRAQERDEPYDAVRVAATGLLRAVLTAPRG